MLQSVVAYTNVKIGVLRSNIVAPNCNKSTYQDIDLLELEAIIGLLIFSGSKKDGNLRTLDMFSTWSGRPFYKAVSSRGRFEFILRALRFDNPDTRAQRSRGGDKFYHIRELWDTTINNGQSLWVCGPVMTVDEQLAPTRAKCPFKMYIPSKPAKYGIKFFMVNDAESRYCLNSFPYLGKGSAPTQEDQNQGHYFVKELLNNLMEPGRTLCHDSWFTSVPLAKDLLNSGIHTVGTIRPKPYLLSKHTLKNIQLPIGESVATFHHEDKINVVYKRTKSAKFVNLLTTIHNRLTYVEHGKTEAHMWYNASKGGTDTFDQMCWVTSVNRKTARWPLCSFYALLNIIVNNAWIIYRHQTEDQERTDKIDFMQNMAYELCLPFVQHRHSRIGKYLPRPIQNAMETVFNVDPANLYRSEPELQQPELQQPELQQPELQ